MITATKERLSCQCFDGLDRLDDLNDLNGLDDLNDLKGLDDLDGLNDLDSMDDLKVLKSSRYDPRSRYIGLKKNNND